MSLSHIFIKAFIKGVGNASGGIILLLTSWKIMRFLKIQKYIEEDIFDYEVNDNKTC